MRLRVWMTKDYESVEIPDDLLRPLVEQLTIHRDWDRDLDRLGRLINRTRLAIRDHVLLESQRPQGAPSAADAVDAAAILDEAEAMSAAQLRMAKAREALAAKRAAKMAGVDR